MRASSRRIGAALAALLLHGVAIRAHAQDISRLGGDLTSKLPGRHAIQVTAPNVSSEFRRLEQLEGFAIFHRLTTVAEGLGPAFVNRSCGGCHVQSGRGPARLSSSPAGDSTMIVKVSLKDGLSADGAPKPVPGIGLQIQSHQTSGLPTTRARLTWQPLTGKYPDGTPFTLRRPRLSISIQGASSRGINQSLRMAPALIGMGLLEAIPEEAILALSDPDDRNNDGVSGRPNYVIDRATGEKKIGRFGFKGSHPTLAQQSAAAAFLDIGVTNPLFPALNGSYEMPSQDFSRLVIYQQIAGVPSARNQTSPSVVAGKSLFQRAGCDACHTMTVKTASDADPEVSNQTIHPFSDLLLHDMGPDLADKRSEFSASGSEWRTTPLWGLGFSSQISDVTPVYLHDGRARSIEEAILWHGGEAALSKDRFVRFSAEERFRLVRFLQSL